MTADIEKHRAEFEADAGPYGFDLTRQSLPVPEPWSEYADEATGHRWAGFLAARQSKPSAADAAEAVRLAGQLETLHLSKRSRGGIGGQQCGLESYSIQATGAGLECLMDAASLLLRLAGIEGSPRANEGSGPVNEGSSAGRGDA